MATMKASRILCTSPSCSYNSSSTSSSSSRRIRSTINMPRKLRENTINNLVSKLTSSRGLVEEMDQYASSSATISLPKLPAILITKPADDHDQTRVADPAVITKMYAIMEAVADRVEMHKNIGQQRDNWNSLLLTSINAITLTAATISGIAAASSTVVPMAALKLSSTLLYLGATGMLIIMNKIQPSQLAEEQRNATRLFKQLHGEIQTKLAIEIPTNDDVNEAIERMLALDRAFPLPLLGRMLEKFPSKVEPAVWWPQQRIRRQAPKVVGQNGQKENGWNGKLEEEMREIIRVLEIKDKDDYLGLGKKALKLNKVLAIAGPLLSGVGAVASASNGSWAVVLGVVAGAIASVVNTLEHGGQVGMVFEMYRSNAGFFRLMQESIESNLKERDLGRRENGELFEMKIALQLGRSLPELRGLAASSARKGKDIEEFASKLF